jgi:hypothetical protein
MAQELILDYSDAHISEDVILPTVTVTIKRMK